MFIEHVKDSRRDQKMSEQNSSDKKSARPLPTILETWWPLGMVAAVAIFQAALYVASFGTTRGADHARWGQFGDFFGGVLNPIVGIVTVLLVIRGLRMQTQEFRDSIDELERSANAARDQLNEMKSSALREMLMSRAERVFEEIVELLEQNEQHRYQHQNAGWSQWNDGMTDIPLEAHFQLNANNQRLLRPDDANAQSLVRSVAAVASLLRELAEYLERIDGLAGGGIAVEVTDFFRRRVHPRIKPMADAGYLAVDVAERLQSRSGATA